ncbi:hypothetical protein [Cellulosilyticum sp. I15G10I2]|uniref:hypothetical protein n=1 Tax=Cellulosilyticum sp. I15G10I2 TaxID=1892843 RepID=UPI00085C370F|nr:hypothetical protein [Cellulosilyticum sp. I15G10I2]
MNISDEILALCELSNDLLFHKIPRHKYSYYIKSSLNAGKQAAKAYLGEDIRELYKKNGLVIEYCETTNSYCGVKFRAQVTMGKEETIVTLYTKSLNEFAQYSSFEGNASIAYETALDVHLCHEFYHFLEHKANTSVSETLDSVETIKLPFFTRRAHINRCSEIAAHAFAQEMLGLDHLPNIYDYIYLVNTSQISKENFDKMIVEFGEKLFDINLSN